MGYKMYVINQEGEQVYDSFSLPSACLCHHKSNFAIRNDLKAEANNNLPFCPKAETLSIPNITKTTTTAVPDTTKKPVRKIAAVKFGDRKRRHASPGPHPHKCLNGNSYCESKEDCPDSIILKVLEKNKELSVDLFQQLYDSKCKDPIQTRGFNIDEEQLCYGIPKIIYPRKAKNFGEKKEPTDFGVCLYSGAQGNNPDLTVCRQIYTEHKLLAPDPEKGQLLVDSFKLPSACACFVREDFILEFRSNMESETDKSIVEATQPTLPPQVEQEEGEKFQFAG